MAKVRNRLTARFVQTVKPPKDKASQKYGDKGGMGLYLKVMNTGAKFWGQRITVRKKTAGKKEMVDLGLGSYPFVSLQEAREEAFGNAKLARTGVNPKQLREQESTKIPTFAEAMETVIKIQADGWKESSKSEKQWRSSLNAYALPLLGDYQVDQITSADVLDVLLPIWNKKRETATRVRQRIKAIMHWAISQGYRNDNPAGPAISGVLPKTAQVKKHHAYLHYSEVADAIRTVQQSGAQLASVLAFEFLVLTATRSGEVRLATWDEINLDNRVSGQSLQNA